MLYSWFYSINFLFTCDFIQKDNSDYVWNKTLSSHVLQWKSLIWVQMSTLGLFWTQNEFFIDLVFTINLSFDSRGYCWLVFYHQFTQWVVFSFKKIYKILFKKKKKSFSHVLTWKSLILVQMITLRLFWTQNEILVWIWKMTLSSHFRKPKAPIFVPKSYTQFILAQTRLYRFHFN